MSQQDSTRVPITHRHMPFLGRECNLGCCWPHTSHGMGGLIRIINAAVRISQRMQRMGDGDPHGVMVRFSSQEGEG